MNRKAFDDLIVKGEVIHSERCINYAKMGLSALIEGRDIDAYAYLDKARYEFELKIEELPF